MRRYNIPAILSWKIIMIFRQEAVGRPECFFSYISAFPKFQAGKSCRPGSIFSCLLAFLRSGQYSTTSHHRKEIFLNTDKSVNVSSLRQILSAREQYLQELIHQKQQSLSSAPAGSLRITHCKKHPRYYLYTGPSENPHYLKNKKLVRRLAQKSYDEKILQTAQKEQRHPCFAEPLSGTGM